MKCCGGRHCGIVKCIVDDIKYPWSTLWTRVLDFKLSLLLNNTKLAVLSYTRGKLTRVTSAQRSKHHCIGRNVEVMEGSQKVVNN